MQSPITWRISARAPVRILDLGGWTDTWFAKRGLIFNIGINDQCTECTLEWDQMVNDTQRGNDDDDDGGGGDDKFASMEAQSAAHRVVLCVENYNEKFSISIDPVGSNDCGLDTLMARHPLLCSTLTYFLKDNWLSDKSVKCKISLHSRIPAGSSMGTSSSVLVCLIAVLDMLAKSVQDDDAKLLSQMQIAKIAHRIEFDRLQMQCGIQDQIACALGGIHLIEMRKFPFDDITVTPIHTQLTPQAIAELESRLLVVFIGPHQSSQVHSMVIEHIEKDQGGKRAVLDKLCEPAAIGNRALTTDAHRRGVINYELLGQSMILNTELQSQLHSDLVSTEARQVIDIAKQHNILGYKVNGAGGEGGSITLLTDGDPAKRKALEESLSKWIVIPVSISTSGLRVWKDKITA